MGVSAGALAAGRAVLELGLVGRKEIDSALKSLQKQTAKIGASFTKLGASFAAAGGTMTAAIAACTKGFADFGSTLADMNARTGLSVEKLSALQYAAEQTGTDLGAVEKALKFMAKKGVDVNTFDRLAADIASIEDPTMRAKAAMQAWGKAGTDLLPMIGDLAALTEQARRLGLVMSTDDARAADALGDAMDQLSAQFRSFRNQIGAAVAGPLTSLLTQATEIGSVFIRWAVENRGLIAGVAAFGVGLTTTGVVLGSFGVGLTVAVSAAGALTTAFGVILSPIGAFSLAIGAASIAIAGIAIESGLAGKALDKLKTKFDEAASGASALYSAWKAANDLRNGTFYIGNRRIVAPPKTPAGAPAAAAAPGLWNNSNNPLDPDQKTTGRDMLQAVTDWGKKFGTSAGDALSKAQKEFTDAQEAVISAAGSAVRQYRFWQAVPAMGVAAAAERLPNPEAIFDTTFAKQAFGGSLDREQLAELKGIHRVLKNQSQGLPVI